MQLLIDFYKNLPRLGPGSTQHTLQALSLAGFNSNRLKQQDAPLKIADIGCGTGATTLTLAQYFTEHNPAKNFSILGVDFLQDFLLTLQEKARAQNLDKHINTICEDMQSLPFKEGEFDILWSEGAIYSMGFEKGVQAWYPFLKKNGILALSEITWLTPSRPNKVQTYWDAAYAEMGTAAEKIAILENSGYSILGYFTLPPSCWIDNYYNTVENNFAPFLQSQAHSTEAKALVEEQLTEIALYKEFLSYYSYGMYIAKKI